MVIFPNFCRRKSEVALAVTLAMAPLVCTPQTTEPSPGNLALRPTGVLANASAAAAAAADAARAAAEAATAAAKAATAAVDAINKLAPTVSAQRLAQESQPASTSQTPPVFDDSEEAGTSTAFIAPTEKTLVGLVGAFEVPVSVDSTGDYARGLAGKIAELDFSVTSTKEINLAESIDAGRSFSRDVLVAGARVDQAKAQEGQGLALLLPSINLRRASGIEDTNPTLNPDKSATQHTRNDYSLSLTQPLVNLPNFFDYRRRGVIAQAREENRRAADGDAYLQSVSAYLSLVSTRLQADMARSFEMQLKELLVYIEKRAAAGASSASDKSRVSARAQAAISARIEQESAHTAAGVDYVRITNLAPRVARIPEIEDLGSSLIPSSLEQAIDIALGSNPDIAALITESRAAKLDADAAKYKYLPRLDLELTNTQSYGASGDPSSAGQREQRAMLVLNWNLFSGGADARAKDERKARHSELLYRLDDQRRRVIQALSAQYASLAATRNRINSGYEELGSITEAAEAMSKRKLAGNQSLLDLLDVYDRYYQTRTRLVNLHVQEMNAVAQIVRQIQAVPSGEVAAVSAQKPQVKATPRPAVFSKESTPTTVAPSNINATSPPAATSKPVLTLAPIQIAPEPTAQESEAKATDSGLPPGAVSTPVLTLAPMLTTPAPAATQEPESDTNDAAKPTEAVPAPLSSNNRSATQLAHSVRPMTDAEEAELLALTQTPRLRPFNSKILEKY